CIGLQRLAKCYGDARLEAAAARALAVDSCSFRGIESILRHRLDEAPAEPADPAEPVDHDNIRGARYYQ
ncbi:MAG: IS21 family transposase, partial [Gammaproteobacteria bacterium]|nr:IS21 family transposase [Gammaproteobacteria bacterium]